MRRRRARPQFHEPSLVPMADMLTNTVGVVLFILIFTVLTAGGAVLTKRLPMEHTTDAKPLGFLCVSGRIVPLELDDLSKEFWRPIGHRIEPGHFDEFVSRFKSRRVENDSFVLTGEFDRGFRIVIEPKPGIGETTNELAAPSSKYRSMLAGVDPQDKYIDFQVYPSGLTVFRAARDLANNSKFGTTWTLYGASERLSSCVNCSNPGQATIE